MHAFSVSSSSLFISMNIKAAKLSLGFWFMYCLFLAQGFCRGWTAANEFWADCQNSYWNDPRQKFVPPYLLRIFGYLQRSWLKKLFSLSKSKVQFIFSNSGPAGLLRIPGTRQLCLALPVTVTSRKPIITGKPSKHMSAYGLQKEKTVRLK